MKCVTVAPNRLVYSLTPRGVIRKTRLTYEFMKYSLDFYRDARQHLRRSLVQAVAQRRRIAVYGTGDAAELVFLLIREMGLELVAVFDGESDRQFLGHPVLPIDRHGEVAYDVMVVAVLERPAGTIKLLRQLGVPDTKVLMLRPDWSATQPAANGTARSGRVMAMLTTASSDLQTRPAEEWVIEPRGRSALGQVREIWVYRRLFVYFGKRSIERLYQNTALGPIWLFIRPLFPIAIRDAGLRRRARRGGPGRALFPLRPRGLVGVGSVQQLPDVGDTQPADEPRVSGPHVLPAGHRARRRPCRSPSSTS